MSAMKILPGFESPMGIGQAPAVNPEGEDFAEMLGKFINSVEQLGVDAGAAKEVFLNGGDIDLHEVMIKAQEAGIATDLLLEIRNKLVEAYQQVIRMPL